MSTSRRARAGGTLGGASRGDRGEDRQQGTGAGRGDPRGVEDLERDISSHRRGGLRSGHGPGGRTYDQLYEEAKDLGIEGRSKMNKRQLVGAVEGKKRRRR